jgi:uncharacterized LabA/DUF88 family protein
MFKAITPKIEDLSKKSPRVIAELEKLFVRRVNMYIDYANIKPWAIKLGWHIDLKRLYQFLRSFDTIKTIGLYYGTLQGDPKSEQDIKDFTSFGYNVRTKPVKIMRISIDATSISSTSPDLLKSFIRTPLLREFDIKTIEHLNRKLQEMNKGGMYYLEDRKCNFDVEIGRDLVIDYEHKEADCFVLWSGDSDFHDPLYALLKAGKNVILFATARKVASELNDLRSKGLLIFDIAKLRNFICWNRELGRI